MEYATKVRRELYIDRCTLNDRVQLAWFGLGIWKQRYKVMCNEYENCDTYI